MYLTEISWNVDKHNIYFILQSLNNYFYALNIKSMMYLIIIFEFD